MLLILDNLDSFTYNLVQAFEELGASVLVRRSDQFSLAQMKGLRPSHLVVSPGPGHPQAATLAMEAMRSFAGKIPVLGVCLGHQCLALACGAVIEPAARLLHGKTSAIRHTGEGIFHGLPDGFEATRYHSLLVRRQGLPERLSVTAWTDEGEIMGLRDRSSGAQGVQFHPESILTLSGKHLLANFLSEPAPC